tara:strand:- start:210 stop:464 length:255 start_codon:yes stop_codon:yes gene_type:complete
MALLTLNLDVDNNYKTLVEDLYRILGYLVIFHIFVCFNYGSRIPSNFGLSGNLFNDNFLSLCLIIVLTVLAYNLVFKYLIEVDF